MTRHAMVEALAAKNRAKGIRRLAQALAPVKRGIMAPVSFVRFPMIPSCKESD